MSISNETIQSERSERRPARRRWLVAMLLMGVTVAGGVAARMGGGAPLPTPATPLDFAAPSGGPVHFGARLDRGSVLIGGDGLVNLELAIRGDRPENEPVIRIPTDLVVVLDRSGSMGGAPIEHARASVRELLGSLASDDRFALVSYASGAETTIALGYATPEARGAWLRQLGQLGVGGGTNMAAGLDAAARTLDRHRGVGRATRVILLSDGHANEGDASRDGLVARAQRISHGESVLSSVGVGDGFDEQLMNALADAGTGNFYYVQRSDELGEIFAGEFASARENLASALEVRLDTAPGVELVSAAGYPLERHGTRVSFRPGALFAGQERRIWLTLRVPTAGMPATEGVTLADVSLAYDRAGRRERLTLAEAPRVARVQAEAQFIAAMDKDVWEESVAQEQLGALKQTVADAMASGRRDDAVEALRGFEAKQQALNRSVKSVKVDAVIDSLATIEQEVDAAFAAPSPAERQRLGKKYRAEGHDERRVGAKY